MGTLAGQSGYLSDIFLHTSKPNVYAHWQQEKEASVDKTTFAQRYVEILKLLRGSPSLDGFPHSSSISDIMFVSNSASYPPSKEISRTKHLDGSCSSQRYNTNECHGDIANFDKNLCRNTTCLTKDGRRPIPDDVSSSFLAPMQPLQLAGGLSRLEHGQKQVCFLNPYLLSKVQFCQEKGYQTRKEMPSLNQQDFIVNTPMSMSKQRGSYHTLPQAKQMGIQTPLPFEVALHYAANNKSKTLRALILKLRVLLYLYEHSLHCLEDCQFHNCRIMKYTRNHCFNCKGCKLVQCNKYKKLISHYEACCKVDCPICSPVKSKWRNPHKFFSSSNESTMSTDLSTLKCHQSYAKCMKRDHGTSPGCLRGSETTDIVHGSFHVETSFYQWHNQKTLNCTSKSMELEVKESSSLPKESNKAYETEAEILNVSSSVRLEGRHAHFDREVGKHGTQTPSSHPYKRVMFDDKMKVECGSTLMQEAVQQSLDFMTCLEPVQVSMELEGRPSGSSSEERKPSFEEHGLEIGKMSGNVPLPLLSAAETLKGKSMLGVSLNEPYMPCQAREASGSTSKGGNPSYDSYFRVQKLNADVFHVEQDSEIGKVSVDVPLPIHSVAEISQGKSISGMSLSMPCLPCQAPEAFRSTSKEGKRSYDVDSTVESKYDNAKGSDVVFHLEKDSIVGNKRVKVSSPCFSSSKTPIEESAAGMPMPLHVPHSQSEASELSHGNFLIIRKSKCPEYEVDYQNKAMETQLVVDPVLSEGIVEQMDQKSMHLLSRSCKADMGVNHQTSCLSITSPTLRKETGRPISLLYLLTPQEVRQHICSLMQDKAVITKMKRMEVQEINPCSLCGEGTLFFQSPGQSTNSAESAATPELLVQCAKCKDSQHEICALFNGKLNKETSDQAEYICPFCCLEEVENGKREPVLQRMVIGAKELRRTNMSDHIEQWLFRRLGEERFERAKTLGRNVNEVLTAEGLSVRVVSSVDVEFEVKPSFREVFQEENYPVEFSYKSKAVMMFQAIEGVDVLLFSMYVQEYGSECPEPNRRHVCISYIDSVKHFRPEIKAATGEALRTFVYHELLIGYLDYCKNRGFTSCYIWCCPPTKHDDYIFHCHPRAQKIPQTIKLREWYQKIIRKAMKERIVVEKTNLYDRFFVHKNESKAKITAARLPYFDNDFWPGEAERIMQNLLGDKPDEKQKKAKAVVERALRAARRDTSLIENENDALLMNYLGDTIQPVKEDFIVLHLHHTCRHCCRPILSGVRWVCDVCKNFQLCGRCHNSKDRHPINSNVEHSFHRVELETALRDTNDDEETIDCEILNTRCEFLNFCQGNRYQFDTLRRAKHSTTMILDRLHNPAPPASREERPDLPNDSRMDVVLTDALLHSSACVDRACRHPHCRRMKSVFHHGATCTVRKKGGCELCARMWRIIIVHARRCDETECNVPRCRDLKGKI